MLKLWVDSGNLAVFCSSHRYFLRGQPALLSCPSKSSLKIRCEPEDQGQTRQEHTFAKISDTSAPTTTLGPNIPTTSRCCHATLPAWKTNRLPENIQNQNTKDSKELNRIGLLSLQSVVPNLWSKQRRCRKAYRQTIL